MFEDFINHVEDQITADGNKFYISGVLMVIKMSSVDRDLFEVNDMKLLHLWFEEGKSPASMVEIHLPEIKGTTYSDLWTKAIDGMTKKNNKQLQALYIEISNSDMPQDSKAWWLSLLLIMMDAPHEMIVKLAEGNKIMPKDISPDCITVAARILADFAVKQKSI